MADISKIKIPSNSSAYDIKDTTARNNAAMNLSSIGMSKKNLLKNTAITKEKNGFTFTINDDGSITVNGPANESVNTDFPIGTIKTKNGVKYILSGCPQGGSSSSYRLNMRHEGQTTNVYPDTGKGVSFTGIEETMTVYILIYMNTEMNNVTFYPMIRYADITDDAYEPYTEDLQTQINNTIALNLSSIGMSKKNLLPFPQTITKGGIKFTCDTNGYMSASNTSSDIRQFDVSNSQYSVNLKAGKYILSFVSSTVCTNSFGNIMALTSDNTRIAIIGQSNYANKTSGSVEFTLDNEQTIYVMSKIFDGVTAVMIRYADITDGTYEPYTEDLQTQINNNNNDIALNLSSIGMSRKNLLKNTATSTSPNKVTYTVNSNGSVTVTNTETTPGNATLNVNTNFKLNPGTYILTGDTEISKVGDLRISVNNSVYYTGTPFTLTKTSTVSYVRIYVYQNCNLGGTATVYPMLRYADIIDDTYEPYREDLQTQINNILARLTAAGI